MITKVKRRFGNNQVNVKIQKGKATKIQSKMIQRQFTKDPGNKLQ